MYEDKRINIAFEGMTSNKGGTETFIINVYNKLDKSRFKSYFIAYEEKIAYEEYLRESGAVVVHLTSRYESPVGFCSALRQFFKGYRVDIIWAHKTTLSSCESLMIAKLYHVPVRIIHGHSSDNMGNSLTALLHSMNRVYIRHLTTEQFACSELAAKYFFGKHKAKIIRNALDLDQFRYNPEVREGIRETLGCSGKKVIGHVGRFGAEKNHAKLIRVFEKIHVRDDNTRLVLCGDGEERKNIEKLIRHYNLEGSVCLVGNVDNVNEILQGVDIFVMPSLFEGLPFALLEAQTCGLKCVVSDTVSRESDVLGWNEFLPLDASDEIWADAVLQVDLNYDREQGYKTMKDKGYGVEENIRFIEKIVLKEESNV